MGAKAPTPLPAGTPGPMMPDGKRPALIYGDYHARRVDPEVLADGKFPWRTFAVFKGDAILALVIDHPCGEWTVQPVMGIAFRHETLTVLAGWIDLAEDVWRAIRGATPWAEGPKAEIAMHVPAIEFKPEH